MSLNSTLIIDRKYVAFIGYRLRNFQHKDRGTAAFTHSCERHDSRKRRGYFLEFKGSLIFKCHNCGASCSFGNFLKDFDPSLAKEYRMECFREGIFGDYKEEDVIVQPTPIVEAVDTNPLFHDLVNFEELSAVSPPIKYLVKRQIPRQFYGRFFLVKSFYRWATQIDEVFKNFKIDHPRLVIPYYNQESKLIGFACRAFGKETPKYIQLRLNKTEDFIYGLDKVDTKKLIPTLEGQIDSLFIDNAVAVGNANYSSDFLEKNKENVVIIPDNDFRRNPQVCAQLKKAIQAGFAICILPDHWKKDVNAIIQSGITKQEIQNYIQTNTKRGLAATLEFTLEKKC